MRQTRGPLLLLICGLILFIGSGTPAFMANMAAYADTTYTLSAPGVQDVTYQSSSMAAAHSDGTVTVDAGQLPGTGRQPWQRFDVQVVYANHTEDRTFMVLDKWAIAGSAGLGLLLMVLTAPTVLFGSTRVLRTDTNRPVTGWYYLLAEPQGLSLSRVQLFIWFLPAILCYALLAWPVHQLPDVPGSLLPLLGLGGATAALSSAVTHPPGATSAPSDGGGGGGGEPVGQPTPAQAATPLRTVQTAYQQAAVSVQSAPPADGGNWGPPDVSAGTAPAAAGGSPSVDAPGADGSAPTVSPAAAMQPALAMQPASFGGQTPAAATLTPEVLAQAFVLAMQQAQQNQAPAQQTAPAASLPPVYVEPPRLSDLVEDFSGYGDVSRYQYLLLCLIAAASFFVTFLQTWQVPDLPAQFVPLVATSQATYLAVKGIKYLRDPKARPQQ